MQQAHLFPHRKADVHSRKEAQIVVVHFQNRGPCLTDAQLLQLREEPDAGDWVFRVELRGQEARVRVFILS